MKRASVVIAGLVLCGSLLVFSRAPAQIDQAGGPAALERARSYQRNGQTAELRAAVSEVLRAAPGDVATRLAAAQLLDLAASPGRASAYQQTIDAAGSAPEAQLARRRLVLLHLINGEQDEARKLLEAYRAAGGQDLEWPSGGKPPCLPASASEPAPQDSCPTVEVPGPLLALERMAAIRPETALDEVLPALARNVCLLGYRYSVGDRALRQTEYLKLVRAYLRQAREFQALAGADKILRVSNCDEGRRVLKVLGYRVRGGHCEVGPESRVEVEDPARAFLSNNSGFPVMLLETALRGGPPLEYSVAPVRLPVLFAAEAWGKPGAEWIDSFMDDYRRLRLYAALSALDSRTAELLRKSPGIEKLQGAASALDFYGRMLRIENGRVEVPGGAAAADAWKQIAGAAPDHPADFIRALLTRDDAWPAAWFDTLWYANAEQLEYLTSPARMVRFYRAIRGDDSSPSPARSVFRNNAQLLLLVTGLRIAPGGKPMLPGGVGFWKAMPGVRSHKVQPKKEVNVFSLDPPREDPSAPTSIDEDDVMEALFARTREAGENGRLNVFLALNEIDRPRPRSLAPETVARLAAAYPRLSQHYALFASWPQLSDATIMKVLDAFEALAKIDDSLARADALGSFQALIAGWEIAGRQGEIPESEIESSLTRLVQCFSGVSNAIEVTDAARHGVAALLALAGSAANPDDSLLSLLSGPPAAAPAAAVRDEIAARMRAALDSQRLVSLETLFALASQLEQGRPAPDFAQLAAALKQANPPAEGNLPDRSAGVAPAAKASGAHLEAEADTGLPGAVQACGARPGCLPPLRGLLAPFLRDTLVGFIYAYYLPPGSTLLQNNPLFVRSHDFLGASGRGTGNQVWGPEHVSLLRGPWNGGGRFVGSLSGIAYALADAEKEFLVPTHTQALIWGELAPQVLLSGTLPRWWGVSPRTQHWAALHLRLGRDLLAEASVAADARGVALGALRFVEPRRLEDLENALLAARPEQARLLLTPAELFRLSRALLGAGGGAAAIARRASPAAAAIEQMAAQFPQEASPAAVSAAFGVPHPKLCRSYRLELLDVRLFPTMMGYSSRLLAETWESGNLYWAEIADELSLPPVELNRLVPAATRETLERIYANGLDDWPALLEAMRATGAELRARGVSAGLRGPAGNTEAAAQDAARQEPQ